MTSIHFTTDFFFFIIQLSLVVRSSMEPKWFGTDGNVVPSTAYHSWSATWCSHRAAWHSSVPQCHEWCRLVAQHPRCPIQQPQCPPCHSVKVPYVSSYLKTVKAWTTTTASLHIGSAPYGKFKAATVKIGSVPWHSQKNELTVCKVTPGKTFLKIWDQTKKLHFCSLPFTNRVNEPHLWCSTILSSKQQQLK
jgi:hypothetical protein